MWDDWRKQLILTHGVVSAMLTVYILSWLLLSWQRLIGKLFWSDNILLGEHRKKNFWQFTSRERKKSINSVDINMHLFSVPL